MRGPSRRPRETAPPPRGRRAASSTRGRPTGGEAGTSRRPARPFPSSAAPLRGPTCAHLLLRRRPPLGRTAHMVVRSPWFLERRCPAFIRSCPAGPRGVTACPGHHANRNGRATPQGDPAVATVLERPRCRVPPRVCEWRGGAARSFYFFSSSSACRSC